MCVNKEIVYQVENQVDHERSHMQKPAQKLFQKVLYFYQEDLQNWYLVFVWADAFIYFYYTYRLI